MKKIVFASHVTTIGDKQYDGIGNSLIATMIGMNRDFIFVRHSMDGLIKSEIHTYKNGKTAGSYRLKVFNSVAPLRYMTEIFASVAYFTFKSKANIYVGIDPLNAVTGIILKKISRVDKVIFYTSDYSEKRFKSKFLSKVYHWIDSYCVKHADEVWSVSSRIVDIRKNMGLDDSKNIFVPNVPPLESNISTVKKDKFKLITSGIIDRQLDFEGTLKAMDKLKTEYPKISLTIVGNSPIEDGLKKLTKKLGLGDRVEFTGRLSLKETLQRTSRAGVGLALYTGVWGFNKYGDSTKCREYFNYGLPVLSTDTHSTVKDIVNAKAGIISTKTVSSYVSGLRDIFDHYDEYSTNSLSVGKKYEGVHAKEISRILQES